MGKVEEYTEELLSKIDNKDMYNIWLETENGILSIEQAFDNPERWEMIHDIDIQQQILDAICQERKGYEREREKHRKQI